MPFSRRPKEKALAVEEDADRREHELDGRDVQLEARARQLEGDLATVDRQRKDLDRRQTALSKTRNRRARAKPVPMPMRAEARRTLERVAGLTAEEARAEMLASIEVETRREAADWHGGSKRRRARPPSGRPAVWSSTPRSASACASRWNPPSPSSRCRRTR
jgi:hypothetical protein